MSRTAFLPFRHELVLDWFAGGGGASTGIEAAIGRPVDLAVNHSGPALAMHAANHPSSRHICSDVFEVDPIAVTRGQPVGLAWFSPDCTFFSKARGAKPFRDPVMANRRRGLAWVVAKVAAKVRPRVIMLENVEEFESWGPLGADGLPDPARAGLTFRRWKREITRLGYKVEFRQLRAHHYGVPTIRKRLFMIARCDGRPIVWPEETHGPGLQPYRAAAECIDWSLPCHSIFLTKEQGRAVGVKRPLAEATMRRIARGMWKFVIDNPRPFIVPYYGGGKDRAHDTDEPLRTVLSDPKFALIEPMVLNNMSNNVPHGAGEPLSTICGGNHKMLLEPFVSKFYGDRVGSSAGEPLHTVMASSAKHAVVAPVLVNTRNGERRGQAPRVRDLLEPAPTVTAEGSQGALVAAFLAKHYGGNESPGAGCDAPLSTITSRDHHHLVTSHLLKMRRHSDGSDMREPLDTLTAGGNHFAEVRAFLAKFRFDSAGRPLDEPMPTVTANSYEKRPGGAPPLGLVTVTIAGEPYVIVDIGMRMLTPRELFNAQGFPRDYIIDPIFEGKPLTKEQQIGLVGNSVCPGVATALVRANFAHEQQYEAVTA